MVSSIHPSLKSNFPRKIVIVGGVAGGASAAARLSRLSNDLEITVYERSGNLSFANCGLPYYLGQEIQDREELLFYTPESLSAKYRLKAFIHHEVQEIHPDRKTVTVKNLDTQETFEDSYDALLLSPGASPIRPPIPGIDQPGNFTLRNIEDTDAIEAWLNQHPVKTVVVAGGGFIGIEMAEQMKKRGYDVSLVEGRDQILAPFDPEMAQWLHDELEHQGVHLYLGQTITEFKPSSAAKGSQLLLSSGQTLEADMVILGLGVRAENQLAKTAGLKIGKNGGIWVNEYLQTSEPSIWAVGDAIEVDNPVLNEPWMVALGGPANRQGRLVANNMLMDPMKPYKGTFGTAILRVFDLTAASTGVSEKMLHETKIPYEAIHLHPASHAGYYPGAERIAMKVLFNRETGELLGAQMIGKDGVDKRMDVFATAMQSGLAIEELIDLELCYAPPFGSAKDPINLVGMIGENIRQGRLTQRQWSEVQGKEPEQYNLLDVREPDETVKGILPGATCIPLAQLPHHLGKIDLNKPTVVYCQSGQRSYYASQLLRNRGYQVQNLSGAYRTWLTAQGLNKKEPATV